ncbi:hydroxypyruvate isomerase family protein [Limnobacter sp.]|uniref:hydroxypyruvate isomerase family protein n=1 Tax=Limnobacter sp. TaxID=2003368 RepID=UPI0035164763
MKLAANLSLMYTEWAFVDRIAAAAEDGFKHVECMFPYECAPEQLQSATNRAGVDWLLINAPCGNWSGGDRGLACLPNRRDEFKEAAYRAAEYALALRVPHVHVLAGVVNGQPHEPSIEDAWACYEDNLRWLCREMAHLPIVWLIEPINTRDVPGYLLNTQAQAHAMVMRIDAPNLGVQMDLYHCQIMEGDVIRKLEAYLPTGRVKHIQIAGVPERHEPDLSELHYPRVFECLQALAYQGGVGCEYRPKQGTRAGLHWRSTMRI